MRISPGVLPVALRIMAVKYWTGRDADPLDDFLDRHAGGDQQSLGRLDLHAANFEVDRTADRRAEAGVERRPRHAGHVEDVADLNRVGRRFGG